MTGGPTQASDSRGTAYYTAPELLNDEAGDHRADLWSVGAMMYALMTMRDVDLGDPEEPLEIPPPALLVPKIPRAISDVVMRALAAEEVLQLGDDAADDGPGALWSQSGECLSLIHISEPTRPY